MSNQYDGTWHNHPERESFCVSRLKDGMTYREIAKEATAAFGIPFTSVMVENKLKRSGYQYKDFAKQPTTEQKVEELLSFLPIQMRDEMKKRLDGLSKLVEVRRDEAVYTVPLDQRAHAHYPAISTEQTYRVVQIGDLHWPFHHEAAVRAVTRFFEDVHPDLFVMNGDIWDAAALCKYPVQSRRENRRMDLGEEMKTSMPTLKRLIEASGETIYTGGNHDIDRKERILANEAKGLAYETNTIWHMWNHFGFPKIKFFEQEYKGHFLKIGSGPQALNMFHGHLYPQHTAAKNVTSELPGESSAQSHTHRPQIFFWRGKLGAVTGHLMDEKKQNYMPSPSWTKGFNVYEFFDFGTKFTVTPVQVYDDGSFAYAGKVYSGAEEKIVEDPKKKEATRKVLEKKIASKKTVTKKT